MSKKLLSIFLLVVLVITGCQGNPVSNLPEEMVVADVMETVNVDYIFNNISELAKEEYKGRYPGDEGIDLAADFLASKMKEYGFSTFNGDDDYLNPFEMYVFQNESNPEVAILDENDQVIKAFMFNEEYAYSPWSRSESDMEEVPFIYEGGEINAGDVLNRIVLIPWKHRESSWNQDFSGAKAMVSEYQLDSPDLSINHFMKSVYCPQYPLKLSDKMGTLRLRLSEEAFAEVLKNTEMGNKFRVKANYQQALVETNNVIGVIEGKDRDGKDDYILLTGHYDHLGDNLNGTYNAGALDNASGIAFALEMGRVIKEADLSLDATIVVVGFSGEEESLVGSTYFVHEYQDIFKDAVIINYDMVGHKNDTAYDIAYTNNQYGSKLMKDLQESAKKADFTITTMESGGSDHGPFAEAGMQAVTIIEYDTSEYHHYTDTPDKIEKQDYPPLARMLLEYIKMNDEKQGE